MQPGKVARKRFLGHRGSKYNFRRSQKLPTLCTLRSSKNVQRKKALFLVIDSEWGQEGEQAAGIKGLERSPQHLAIFGILNNK